VLGNTRGNSAHGKRAHGHGHFHPQNFVVAVTEPKKARQLFLMFTRELQKNTAILGM
jgi:hypothetical protein